MQLNGASKTHLRETVESFRKTGQKQLVDSLDKVRERLLQANRTALVSTSV
jgi:hypothetical protein